MIYVLFVAMAAAVSQKHGYYTDADCKTAAAADNTYCTTLETACVDVGDLKCKFKDCAATYTYGGKGSADVCKAAEDAVSSLVGCKELGDQGTYQLYEFNCKSGAAALSMI